MAQHAETEHIYKRIALETLVEINFATDGRHADAVAVMRDAGDDAGEEAAVCRDLRMSILWSRPRCQGFLILGYGGACPSIGDWAEAQRVQTKFGPRAHGEDVADDSANAGGCALERLNCTWMIVALDFERDCPAVANIDDPGVFFASFNQDIWSARRKFLQFLSRIFVRAVLAPHHGKDSELGEVRFTPENFLDALEFFRSQAVLRHQLGSDGWIGIRFRHRQRDVSESVAGLNRTNSFEYPKSRPRLSMKGRIRTSAVPWVRTEAINNKGGLMKKSMITLACALIAPVAFAQTSTTTTEQTTTAPVTATETTTTYSSGTVTTYEPGKTIVLKSEQGPVRFARGTACGI